MRASIRLGLPGTAVLALLCGSAPLMVRGAEPVPELDIFARTAVRVSPQHTQMVQRSLTDYARRCLSGLVSRHAPLEVSVPKDGAARFRLFIEHAASLKTANQAVKETLLADRDYFSRFLVTQEKGVYKFRLAQWKDSRYVNVEQWAAPYAVVHHYPLPKSFNSRDLPALRGKSLMQTFPKSIKQALLGRILPIRIGQSRGAVNKTQSCQVIVKNASRWPLKSLEATLRWPEPRAKGQARYEGTITLAKTLAPGRQTVVPCKGKPLKLEFRWEYLEPVEIDASPVFAPADG